MNLEFHHKKLKNKINSFNLFCDGSVKMLQKTSKIGGYISNETSIIQIYQRNLSYQQYYDNNLVELHTILVGIRLAVNLNIKSINIFTDSSVSSELIKQQCEDKINKKYESIVKEIKAELTKFESFLVYAIPRHQNEYADNLTK